MARAETGDATKACCLVSEMLEEAGLDREKARALRRQVLEGMILLCRWQLERMERRGASPRSRKGAAQGGRPIDRESRRNTVIDSLDAVARWPPRRLRIAVIGLSGDEVGWTSQLAGRGVDVVGRRRRGRPVRGGRGARGRRSSPPSGVADLVPQLVGQPIPPLALFVDRGHDPRPSRTQVSLLKVLLSGKKEWEQTFDAILDPHHGDRRRRMRHAREPAAGARARTASIAGASRPAVRRRCSARALSATGDRFPIAPVDPIADSLADGKPRHVEMRYTRAPRDARGRPSPPSTTTRRRAWSSS